MKSPKALHRYSLFVAASTLLLLIAGGLVTSTDSGLSVPDWPNTYGHFMFAYPLDQMVGGIFYEHTHRMIASIVGFLTIFLAVWIWRTDERRWMKMLGLAVLGAIVAQGVLGGLTVLFLLPTAISVGHATLAQTFFVLVSSIALFTSPWWRNDQPGPIDRTAGVPATRLTLITLLAVYVQLILGAWMRHSQAGLAVPDLPLAYGSLLPSLSADALARYNQQLVDMNLKIAADDPVTASQIVIHLLHRGWALVVAGFVLWTSVRLLRLKDVPKRISRLAVLMMAVVVLQLSLGVLTVLSARAVDVTTAHVALGAGLLVVAALTMLHAARIYGFPWGTRRVSFTTSRAAA